MKKFISILFFTNCQESEQEVKHDKRTNSIFYTCLYDFYMIYSTLHVIISKADISDFVTFWGKKNLSIFDWEWVLSPCRPTIALNAPRTIYQDPFANSWTFYINVYHQVPYIHNWKFHFPHIIECLILLMPQSILKCKLRSPRSSFYSSNCKCTSPAT